ncbi:MAG: outer membrane protein assembly factor BamD [Ignavibacteriales bacterium CG12_big_fil_rev_8_21_14_0_65_30_8]|nr:MAG: outer membrane protein assembly factor BamD [Ignavibacteriales bacterium CG12_big_fil_rev_8_21_14_0_65_30_8]
MKKIIKLYILILVSLYFVGCSSSIDTSGFTGEQKLDYAKKLYIEEDYFDALQEFNAIVLEYPGSAIVDDALYYLAMTRFQRSEYILAAFEFSKLIKNMSASEFVPISQFMLAECYYELSPNYTLEQKYTKKAIEEYQAFIDFFPSNNKVKEVEAKIVELNDKLARKELHSAQIYETLGYDDAALYYYSNLIEVYHETQYAPQAMLSKINLLEDREKNQEALAEANKFISRYPNSQLIDQVKKIKASLENKFSNIDK